MLRHLQRLILKNYLAHLKTMESLNIDAVDGCSHEYRLIKITEIENKLTREREKRSILSEKYRKGVRIISVLGDVLVTALVGLGMSGIGVMSTITAAPIAIALDGVALGAGVLYMIGKQVNRKLALRLEKNEKIKTLAEAKLNSISKYVSTALEEDNFSVRNIR